MELDSVSKYLKLQAYPNHTEVKYNGAPCLAVMENAEGYTWAVVPLFARMVYGAETIADIPWCMETFGDIEEAIADGVSKLHELGAFMEYDIDQYNEIQTEVALQECLELATEYANGDLMEGAAIFKDMISEGFAHPNHKKLDKNKNGKLDKEDFKILRGEKKAVTETAYEKDLDPEKKIVVTGVKGAKSTPFTKKFKNMAHYEKFADSEDFGNHEIHYLKNEEFEDSELEQLDELSRKTLKSYVKQRDGLPELMHAMGSHEYKNKDVIKGYYNKSYKLASSLKSAKDRLSGVFHPKQVKYKAEETERLDEVENAFTSVFGPKKTTSSYDLPGHVVMGVKQGPNGETHVKRISKDGNVTTTKYGSSGAAIGKIKHDDEDPKPHFKSAGKELDTGPKRSRGRPKMSGASTGTTHDDVKKKLANGEALTRYEKIVAQKHGLVAKGKAGRKGKELDDAGSEKLFKTLALRSLKKVEKGMKTEEVEQIEELSKDTLKSYLTKTKEKPYELQTKGDSQNSTKKADKFYDKRDNVLDARTGARMRLKGIFKPKQVSYKAEEVEQPEEKTGE